MSFPSINFPFFLERQAFFAVWRRKLSFVFCERLLSFFTREACPFSSTRNFHVLSQKISFHCISKVMLSFSLLKELLFGFKSNAPGQNRQPQTIQGKLQDKTLIEARQGEHKPRYFPDGTGLESLCNFLESQIKQQQESCIIIFYDLHHFFISITYFLHCVRLRVLHWPFSISISMPIFISVSISILSISISISILVSPA